MTDTDTVVVAYPGPYCGFECLDSDWCLSEGEAPVPCEFQEDYSCYDICKADITASCSQGECEDILGCGGCGCELGAGRVVDKSGGECGVEGGARYIYHNRPRVLDSRPFVHRCDDPALKWEHIHNVSVNVYDSLKPWPGKLRKPVNRCPPNSASEYPLTYSTPVSTGSGIRSHKDVQFWSTAQKGEGGRPPCWRPFSCVKVVSPSTKLKN